MIDAIIAFFAAITAAIASWIFPAAAVKNTNAENAPDNLCDASGAATTDALKVLAHVALLEHQTASEAYLIASAKNQESELQTAMMILKKSHENIRALRLLVKDFSEEAQRALEPLRLDLPRNACPKCALFITFRKHTVCWNIVCPECEEHDRQWQMKM